MAFPSDGVEGLYRNSLKEVKRFLDQRHRGHYKIVNLRAEKIYTAEKFGAPVSNYLFADHHPPPLPLFWKFCQETADWLDEDNENIVVIHCKAGKGRTGTMISGLLLYRGDARTAEEAMEIYSTKRTHDGRGVTVPSQVRYVRYFETIIGKGQIPQVSVRIVQMVMHTIPTAYLNGGKQYLAFAIENNDTLAYDHTRSKCDITQTSDQITIDMSDAPALMGDVRVIFMKRSPYISFMDTEVCHFWVNTGFLAKRLTLKKSEIDEAHSDASCREFSESFSIELVCEFL